MLGGSGTQGDPYSTSLGGVGDISFVVRGAYPTRGVVRGRCVRTVRF